MKINPLYLLLLFLCMFNPSLLVYHCRPALISQEYVANNLPVISTTTATSKTLTCDIIEIPSVFSGWPHTITTNALCHALTGNRRRLGYKLAVWNCRKGLLGNNNFDSSKLTDIKMFIQKHNPHVLCIIESNIHSSHSRVQRRSTFNTNEVKSKLKVEGYNIELPDTWSDFGQARILVYVREDINYKRKLMQNNTDLPNVTLDIGLGREKKTILNYFYRE